MGFCSCTIKFILIVFNLICAVAGIAILVVGILTNSKGSSFKTILSGQLTTTCICFIVLGVVIFLIAFFGCCGALREDTCLIQTYAVILLTILIIEVALAITAFVMKGKVKDELRYNYETFFSHYNRNRREIDDIQSSLQCCGYDGPDYWRNLSPAQPIPNSCCKQQNNCDVHNSYQVGCYITTIHYATKMLDIIGGVALGIALVELVAIIFAFYVASSIKRMNQRGYV